MEARTTRTDLGKIVLINGGEYDPDAVYEEKTFVLYQNSTYVALQTVTGIEPTDDRINWQLMAKGFAGSDFEIEGYVYVENDEVMEPAGEPMLNADKLDNKPASYYAPQHEITDAFSVEKEYAIGDYCIYLNSLYRFISAHAPGAFDGTQVIPVTLASELQAVSNGIAQNQEDIGEINRNLHELNDKTVIPWYHITYNDNNKLEALNKINNPTTIFGNTETPYCILFRDNIGNSLFGGGLSCVFGYTYSSDSYGAQITIKHSINSLMIRNKINGSWSDLKIIG